MRHIPVRLLRRAALVVLVADLLVLGARLPAAASPRPRAAIAAVATPRASTTTTAPATTTTVSLPTPIEGGDQTDEPLVVIGRLQIPALGLDDTLYEGISLSTIDHGPSHWPGTALPGHVGNVVIAGHRITHSHPFRHLDALEPGAQAVLSTDEGSFTYEFTGLDVVTPDRVDIADQTMAYTATFFACHPPGSARYRIVAHWRLVGAPAAGQPDPATLG